MAAPMRRVIFVSSYLNASFFSSHTTTRCLSTCAHLNKVAANAGKKKKRPNEHRGGSRRPVKWSLAPPRIPNTTEEEKLYTMKEKFFFNEIVSMFRNREVDERLHELPPIEIEKVLIHRKSGYVNVYWSSTKGDHNKDGSISGILEEKAMHVWSLLVQTRNLRNVPQIRFVKYKPKKGDSNVLNLIKQMESKNVVEQEVWTTTSPGIDPTDDQNINEKHTISMPNIQLRTDIFGLDHSALVKECNRIKTKKIERIQKLQSKKFR